MSCGRMPSSGFMIRLYTGVDVSPYISRRSRPPVALGHHAFFPAVARSTTHRPPGFVGTLTVDCPFAGDGDVGFAVCIYQRAGIVAVQTFPTGDDGREVKALVGGEFQYGSFFHMKIYVAL